jgi:hypothetical protein
MDGSHRRRKNGGVVVDNKVSVLDITDRGREPRDIA